MNMPEMKNVIKGTDKGDDIYEGKGDLGSGGMWQVTVMAQQNGRTIGTRKPTLKAEGGSIRAVKAKSVMLEKHSTVAAVGRSIPTAVTAGDLLSRERWYGR